MSLIVDFCDHAAAKHAVMNWHYSKTVPIGKLVKLGVWEQDEFKGVIIFGRGASNAYGRRFGVGMTEVCELVRIALRQHDTPVTRLTSLAIVKLRESSPGLRVIVSFADTGQGHLGVIYQAGNWTYLGTTTKRYDYFYHGRWVHDRHVNAPTMSGVLPEVAAGMTYAELKRTLPKRLASTKFRYAYPLDRQMRRRLVKMALPYPTQEDLAAQVSEARHRASGPEGQVQSLGAAR